MKFKAVAFLCIGVLLGSTITLIATRPNNTTAEILACTDKASGKTRLTVSGACNDSLESKNPVTDLWGLQPSTSAPPATTATTTKVLKKYVVDAKGKTVGELVSNDGLRNFWVISEGGNFFLSSGSNAAEGEAWAGDSSHPVFSEPTCQVPYIFPSDGSLQSALRLVIKVAPTGTPTNNLQRRAFRPVGKQIETPKFIYLYNTPREAGYWTKQFATRSTSDFNNLISENELWKSTPGCQKVPSSEYDSIVSGGITSTVYKSVRVNLPLYTTPLQIVEK